MLVIGIYERGWDHSLAGCLAMPGEREEQWDFVLPYASVLGRLELRKLNDIHAGVEACYAVE